MDGESEFQRKRRERNNVRYARVRNYDHKVYEDVCAFAGTIDMTKDPLAVRASVEGFCMDLICRMLDRAQSVPMGWGDAREEGHGQEGNE